MESKEWCEKGKREELKGHQGQLVGDAERSGLESGEAGEGRRGR